MSADSTPDVFQTLVERFVDPLFYLTDGVVEWIAPAVEETLGWSPDELLASRLDGLVHEDDVHEFERLQHGALAGQSGRSVIRLRTRSHGFMWVLVTLAPAGPGGITAAVGSLREINLRAEAERRLRMVSDHTSDIVCTIGLDRRVTWVSSAVTRLLDWEPGQIVGSFVDDLLHTDDRHWLEERYLPPLLSGGDLASPERVEVRVRARSGDLRWMQLTATARHGDDGALESLVIGLQDVDELVRARNDVAVVVERLRLILDSLPDPHAMFSPIRDDSGQIVDFAFVEANPAAVAPLGRARQDIQSLRVSEVAPGYQDSPFFAQALDAMESGEPLAWDDVVFRTSDRPEGDRHISVRAVRVGGDLSALWRDVTDRQRQIDAVAASEEKFRLLADNVTDVVVWLQDELVTWVSPSLADTLGWTPEEWEGRHMTDFFHADDLPLRERMHARVSSGQKVKYRARLRAKDLTYHWAEIAVGPFVNAQGAADGTVKSFRLVDREVAAEAALDRRARFDDLTGLVNRNEALERIAAQREHHRRPGDQTAVLFCDVDRFKAVNDTYGHAAGDIVLMTLADRIRSAIRLGDTAARMGGDEMMAVLEGVHDIDDALRVAEKIRVAASQPIEVPGHRLTTSMSVGVTLAQPGESTDDLVARADEAMYRAKQGGRNLVFVLDGASA